MPRILVIEDSPTMQCLITSMLDSGGYEVLTATDGEVALQLAVQEQPNLVLLDVILPKINGYEVCRQLKATPETAHIPVVMLSVKAREGDRNWGLEQGADDYVVKPVDPRQLLDVVGRFVPQTAEATS